MFESLAEQIRRTSDDLRISVEARALSIRISGFLAERLGWQNGERCDLLVGIGDDRGLVRVAQQPDGGGWRLCGDGRRKFPASLRIKIAPTYRGKPTLAGLPAQLKPVAVEARIIDHCIEFRLPWAANAPEPAPIELSQTGPVNLAGAEPPVNGSETEARPGKTGGAEDLVTEPEGPLLRTTDRAGPPTPRYTDRAGPPTPRYESRNDPANWPADVRERFIDAAARSKTAIELSQICDRPTGSIHAIRQKLEREINKRRKEIDSERLHRAAPRPIEHPEELPEPAIPDAVFHYLTKKRVFPQLHGRGHTCGQNREKTKLILNGQVMTPETFVREANILLELNGPDALKLP